MNKKLLILLVKGMTQAKYPREQKEVQVAQENDGYPNQVKMYYIDRFFKLFHVFLLRHSSSISLLVLSIQLFLGLPCLLLLLGVQILWEVQFGILSSPFLSGPFVLRPWLQLLLRIHRNQYLGLFLCPDICISYSIAHLLVVKVLLNTSFTHILRRI